MNKVSLASFSVATAVLGNAAVALGLRNVSWSPSAGSAALAGGIQNLVYLGMKRVLPPTTDSKKDRIKSGLNKGEAKTWKVLHFIDYLVAAAVAAAITPRLSSALLRCPVSYGVAVILAASTPLVSAVSSKVFEAFTDTLKELWECKVAVIYFAVGAVSVIVSGCIAFGTRWIGPTQEIIPVALATGIQFLFLTTMIGDNDKSLFSRIKAGLQKRIGEDNALKIALLAVTLLSAGISAAFVPSLSGRISYTSALFFATCNLFNLLLLVSSKKGNA